MALGYAGFQDPYHSFRGMQERPCNGRGGRHHCQALAYDICWRRGDVRKPPVTFSFRVRALTENRLGAKLVPEYMENITPKEQYDLLEVVKISGFVDRRKGLGRPTKREGRELAKFTEGADADGWDFDFDSEDFDEFD